MNKKGLYYIALVLPLIMRVLLLNTGFFEQLQGWHMDAMVSFFNSLRHNGTFIEFLGGWVLPIFTLVVLVYWLLEEDDSHMRKHSLFLPIAYLIFFVIARVFLNGEFILDALYRCTPPILIYGYIYVIVWCAVIWLLDKIGFAK